MDDALAELTDAPEAPDRETCAVLLGELARLCERGGWERFARPPVVPGPGAFPDRWEKTPLAVATVTRRLIAHAGVDDLRVVIADRRAEAARVSKKAPTEIELASVEGGRARFDLYAIGDDDVAGTIAHEVGAAIAARWHAPDAPYRGVVTDAIDHDARWRGSIAAVHVGLGVLAANAAFQEYKLGAYQAQLGYAPVEYEVLKAGQLTIDELGFLLAVQAVVRGDGVPRGLGAVQADVVRAWRDALADRAELLRAGLGVPAPDAWPSLARPAPGPLVDEPAGELVIVGERPRPPRVFRVPSSRAGAGMMIGMAGLGIAAAATIGGPRAVLGALAGGAVAGYAIGRRQQLERCSACVDRLPSGATTCPHCGGEIAGLLVSRADALDADDAA